MAAAPSAACAIGSVGGTLFGTHDLWLFVLSGLLLNITPGPDPSKPLAFLFLGIVFDFNGTLWNLLVAWSTARISSRFDASGRFKKWFNRCVGSLFVFVGVRLAFAHDR